MYRSSLLFAGIVLLAFAFDVSALTPQEVLRRAEQQVVQVELLDGKSEPFAAFSAVSLGAGKVVTLCDSLEGGSRIVVVRGEGKLGAQIERRDVRRNLCSLNVPGLDLASARFLEAGEPAAGTTVYAIGNVLGFGLSISEGLVSGVRKSGGETYIQFSAPIAPGSEGGGLYDAEGRVVGLIDYRRLDGQNVNFAAPARWVGEMDGRAASQEAADNWRGKAYSLSREASWDALERHVADWTTARPDDTDAWLWLGAVSARRSDWQAAERAYRRAREIDPASIAAAIALAREMLRQQKAQEALEIGRGLLAQRREDGRIWNVIGWAEMQLGRPEAAQQAFSEAAKAEPWNREPHLGTLALTRARGDAAGVVFALQRLISTSPDDRLLWLQLSGAYMQVGRYERALFAAEHLLKNAPDDSDALLHKGGALHKLGRHLEAIETLKKGLAGKPVGPAFGWIWLGNVYYDQKIYPEAIAAYRSAAAHEKPGEYVARANLGLALKDGRHLDEALAVFEKLRDERPDDAYAWRQIGYTLHMMGRLEATLPAYERALAIDPQEGKVWQALVEVYHALGRRDDARRAYDRLRTVDAKRAEEAYRTVLITYEDGK